jgi:hypothetical protein
MMAKQQDCSSCRMKTTGVSKITGKPLCSHCQAKPLKDTTLASLARRPAGERKPKPDQCSICLADDVPLKNGRCKDLLACEARQPPLIPREEL